MVRPTKSKDRFALRKPRSTTNLTGCVITPVELGGPPTLMKSHLDRSLDPDYSSPGDVGRHLLR